MRTRHFLSLARWLIASVRLPDIFSTPITLLSSSKFLNKGSLTSAEASFIRVRNIGRMYSLVPDIPTKPAKGKTFSASASTQLRSKVRRT